MLFSVSLCCCFIDLFIACISAAFHPLLQFPHRGREDTDKGGTLVHGLFPRRRCRECEVCTKMQQRERCTSPPGVMHLWFPPQIDMLLCSFLLWHSSGFILACFACVCHESHFHKLSRSCCKWTACFIMTVESEPWFSRCVGGRARYCSKVFSCKQMDVVKTISNFFSPNFPSAWLEVCYVSLNLTPFFFCYFPTLEEAFYKYKISFSTFCTSLVTAGVRVCACLCMSINHWLGGCSLQARQWSLDPDSSLLSLQLKRPDNKEQLFFELPFRANSLSPCCL